MNTKIKKTVLVGMSGGVDSTAAAFLLQRKGFKVVGVHLITQKNHQPSKNIERLAKQLKIEIIKKDISNIFKDKVIDKFTSDYNNNRTPNPCVFCNRQVKFKTLEKIANELGIKNIATGHYAKITSSNNRFKIKKANDKSKDQSYFLYRLKQNQLRKILFPLGDKHKKDIKKLMNKHKFSFEKKESQDVCFWEKFDTLETYLKRNTKLAKGAILNEHREKIGTHNGYQLYTIGQRKGLNLPNGPFFVISKSKNQNTITVTNNKNNPKLFSNLITISKASWTDKEPKKGTSCHVKTRYRSCPTKAKIQKKISENSWEVLLQKPIAAVTRGQSLVIYKSNAVIGGGVIQSTKLT